MSGIRFVKSLAVSLAALGTALPNTQLLADATNEKTTATKEAEVTRVPDLALADGGTLSGRVCDQSGKVLDGAKVVLKQGKKELGNTGTDKDGVFSFKGLKGGVYQVSSGNTEGVFRVWTKKTAPPAAKEHALLVMGENGARGQFGSVSASTVLLGAGILAAGVVGAVAISKVDSLNSKVNALPVSQ